MKTLKSISAALLPVLFCFTIISVTGISMKTSKPIKPSNSKKPLIHYYFEIEQPSSSNIFIIEGTGTTTSGSVDVYLQGCVNSATDDEGTSSGTYSYDTTTGVMTLDVEVTPHGYTEFTFIGSPISFNNSGYNALNCPPN